MDGRCGLGGAFLLVFPILLLSCKSGILDILPGSGTGLQVKVSTNFSQEVGAGVGGTSVNAAQGSCADLGETPAKDSPAMADGQDCDQDGGVVTHITPTSYTVAFKKVSFLKVFSSKAWSDTDVLGDKNSLAASESFTLSPGDESAVIGSASPSFLNEGAYGPLEMQIYYVQMVIPVGGVSRNVRVYLSDDDFDNEGKRGHHQGDITFIADDGTALGWIDSTWTTLSTERSEIHNGPGGADPQSGHARGLFGDAAFWNSEAFNQGAGQDIFVTRVNLPYPLTFPDPKTIQDLVTVTFQFPVKFAFYFEDFEPQGTGFSPGEGGEATNADAEWAILPSNATVLDF